MLRERERVFIGKFYIIYTYIYIYIYIFYLLI